MKRAILYVRVSTEEQADKGFSLGSQKEQLIKYCEANQINMVNTYVEDHSAKTFERPEFKKMLSFCKQNKGEIDLLLFVKWDRFSRNTKESYQTIHEFQKLNIEARAIEQPLDLSVPESKIMLAIYLASPEVENDRRSLNVFNGMRKAKKEGRYMGIAPKGYKNSRDGTNRPIMVPDADASLIRKAFEEMATGNFGQEEIRRRLNAKGLKSSRNGFNKMMRNPVYAGLLLIPSFKDEEEHFVKANHEPIIEPSIYHNVQEIIENRKPINVVKSTAREEFPMRGFLICCKCGKALTGSTGLSKSKKLYYYYHCSKGCKEIYRTEDVHKAFDSFLASIVCQREVMELYQKVLKAYFGQNVDEVKNKVRSIQTEISKNKDRINKAMQLMLDGEIDSSDYKAIKSRIEDTNTSLLRESSSINIEKSEFHAKVNGSFNILLHLDKFYREANVDVKQKLLGLNFPGKLIYENGGVQTPKMSDVLSLITMKTSDLEAQKKGQQKIFSLLSPEVNLQGFKPRLF